MWGAFLFLIILLALTIAAVGRLTVYFSEGAIVSASGRQNLSFRVFYLENDIFTENPIPMHKYFLMSYTDYVEISSSFTANFSEEMDIHYSYIAEKRMVIQPLGSDRVVFEYFLPMSYASGEVTADSLYFSGENDGGPGGTYVISPRDYIVMYIEFIEDQARQMRDENAVARGLRGFSAELLVDFTYIVRAPDFSLRETVTQGYRIPLTTELYIPSLTGTSNFEWSDSIDLHDAPVTLQMITVFVVMFTGSTFGLTYCIRKLMSSPNKYRQEADYILKKYSHEIVVYDKPVDLNKYEPMAVRDFSELLKLAINLNKHIMCYKNRTRTEFVTIVDDYACIYVINYNGNGTKRPDEAALTL